MPRIGFADEARPLDLEQQKKRAKELCRDLARGGSEAARRFRAVHPKSPGLTDAQLRERLAKVTEAQLVIARELGLPSWPQLRRHITRLASARAVVAAGDPPVLDGDVPTTHVRCGTDIREGLAGAGLLGRFIEQSDPYCQGPVPRDGDLLEIRARFLAGALGIDLERVRGDLRRAESELEATIAQSRVVLWFEHDSHDQLILARILAYYGQQGTPPRLELVHADRFPAVERFHGLGELSAAALLLLWEDRVPVTSELIGLGVRVWRALREPSPVALFDAASSSEVLPQMGGAVLRHLQELPWCGDGLSLTQRLTLELLAEGSATAGNVFVRLGQEREPLVHLGDAMYWVILEDLLRARPASLEIRPDEAGQPWPKRRLSLTDAGYALLAGELDLMKCAPPERWVGGVRIAPGSSIWRWDSATRMPTKL